MFFLLSSNALSIKQAEDNATSVIIDILLKDLKKHKMREHIGCNITEHCYFVSSFNYPQAFPPNIPPVHQSVASMVLIANILYLNKIVAPVAQNCTANFQW